MKKFAELTKGISTFEDVCAKKGDKPESILPYANPINTRQMAANDRERLDYIAEYLQDGFKANYGKWSQEKWFPVFRMPEGGSAFVFLYSRCDAALTYAGCGSRLSLPNEELSDFFGTQFIEIHDRLLANKY